MQSSILLAHCQSWFTLKALLRTCKGCANPMGLVMCMLECLKHRVSNLISLCKMLSRLCGSLQISLAWDEITVHPVDVWLIAVSVMRNRLWIWLCRLHKPSVQHQQHPAHACLEIRVVSIFFWKQTCCILVHVALHLAQLFTYVPNCHLKPWSSPRQSLVCSSVMTRDGFVRWMSSKI